MAKIITAPSSWGVHPAFSRSAVVRGFWHSGSLFPVRSPYSAPTATVTSLTHFIHRFGILPRSRPELASRAWRLYRRQKWSAAADFALSHATAWTKVRFLGVWDTVAALGLPFTWLDVVVDRIPIFRHRLHRFDLSEVVEHGRHAVAIDDPRKSFHPELWPESRRAVGTGRRTVKQVWFAGSHSDVGGGYPEAHLSDIALEWMLSEAVDLDQGLRIKDAHGVRLDPSAYGALHDPRAGGLGQTLPPASPVLARRLGSTNDPPRRWARIARSSGAGRRRGRCPAAKTRRSW